MRVAVLNGSPKGDLSVTLQTVRYLQRKFPQCTFDILHVGQRIRALEADFAPAAAALARADLLLFAYPVYTFLAPYQLHRFIELLKQSGLSLAGKRATQITTSKHFYDVTAHRYIEENCLDLGLSVIGGLSADMDDLLSEKGRAEAVAFWRYVLHCAENDLYLSRPRRLPVVSPYARALREVPKQAGFDTVILTNREEDDGDLLRMIEDFQAVYPHPARVVNIARYPFKGGCLGCFHCAATGACVYDDGFDAFLRGEIQTADAVVYAFTIRDHSMGASMKRYDDRQFCNGHRTVTMGRPVGYLIHGDYEAEANLRLVVEGRAEVGGNFLCGAATDAAGIAALSGRLAYALKSRLALPANFLGVGGMKIFRDLIYLMQGLMREDHRFYKAHDLYDFPQKRRGTMLKMRLVGALVARPSVQRKLGNKMNEGMLAPYQKAIQKDEI